MRHRRRAFTLGAAALTIASAVLSVVLTQTSPAGATTSTTTAASASDVVVLKRGDKLMPGHSIVTGTVPSGPNGSLSYNFELRLRTNGNLVEYKHVPKQQSTTVYWRATAKDIGDAQYLQLNSSGNLVLHDKNGTWDSGTTGIGVAKLVMKSNGNLVLYGSNGNPKWASHNGICAKVGISNGIESSIVSAACRERGFAYCFAGGNQNGPTHGNGGPGCPAGTVGFDCSGLSLYSVYHGTGILLPHVASAQYGRGTHIAKSDLLPGDLVFFVGSDGTVSAPGHVGVYIGAGYMVDAKDFNVPVQIHPLQSDYVGARRFR